MALKFELTSITKYNQELKFYDHPLVPPASSFLCASAAFSIVTESATLKVRTPSSAC